MFRFLIKWIEDLSKIVESKGAFLEERKELKRVEIVFDVHKGKKNQEQQEPPRNQSLFATIG